MPFVTQSQIWKLMDEAHKETIVDIKKKIANGEELSEIEKFLIWDKCIMKIDGEAEIDLLCRS